MAPDRSFWLALTQIGVELRLGGDTAPVAVAAFDGTAFERDLAVIVERLNAAGVPALAVLPASEIVSGTIKPVSLRLGSPLRIARIRASIALTTPIDRLDMSIGRPLPDGSVPWAAALSETIGEAQRFLRICGLRDVRIAPSPDLPPFGETQAGRFALPLGPGGRKWAAAGTAAAAAVALLMILPSGGTPDASEGATAEIAALTEGADAAAPDSVAPGIAAPGAGAPETRTSLPAPEPEPETALTVARRPEARPPETRPETQVAARAPGPLSQTRDAEKSLASVSPPTARVTSPESPPEPVMTKAARNMPADMVIAPAPAVPTLPSAVRITPDDALPAAVLRDIISRLPAAPGGWVAANGGPLPRPLSLYDVPPAAPGLAPGTADPAYQRPRARPFGDEARATPPPLPTPGLSDAISAAVATAAAAGPVAPARTAALIRTSAPAPTAAASEALLTEYEGFHPGRLSLVAVMGSKTSRRAILREANGRTRRVEPGDRIDGMRVVAIGSDNVRLERRGRSLVVSMAD